MYMYLCIMIYIFYLFFYKLFTELIISFLSKFHIQLKPLIAIQTSIKFELASSPLPYRVFKRTVTRSTLINLAFLPPV